MANINLEIGEIHNGKIEYSSGLPYSLRQPAIWRHSRKTWFVCSALMMPGWKECDHKFFSIVEGEKRIIPYPHEWIAQFNKEKEAWTWFRIMASAVKLSNA
ncbi:MAG: hypothetical protein KAJ19_03745, partial [Gammaproteobacteria bacterium]|nr:hypothetical protein [Gammaproteobacteria bacterium]